VRRRSRRHRRRIMARTAPRRKAVRVIARAAPGLTGRVREHSRGASPRLRSGGGSPEDGATAALHQRTRSVRRGGGVNPKLGPRTRRALFALTGAKRIFDDRPLHAQLVITYDCNLSCAYCTEYTPGAPLVPFDVLAAAHRRARGARRDHLRHPRRRAVAAPRRRRDRAPAEAGAARRQLRHADHECLQADAGAGRRPERRRARLHAGEHRYDRSAPGLPKSLKSVLPRLAVLAAQARFRVKIQTVLSEESWRATASSARCSRPSTSSSGSR